MRVYLAALSPSDAALFNELLSRLDANPIEHSDALLVDGHARLRRATFGTHIRIFEWEPWTPPAGRMRLTRCRPA